MLIACLAGAAYSPHPAYGAEPIQIGILAFPSKPQAQANWQPLAVVLKQAMPTHDFQVLALDIPELNEAVAARQLDFVLTNSGHYVLLRSQGDVSAPLATLATDVAGQAFTTYGGVIFTRAGNDRINILRDIKAKTVAAVDIKSQGAYQMQAYELSLIGIRPQDFKLLRTGLPQGQIVAEVLAGRAEVGFVSSGVLEKMVRQGKLDIKQLKIINRQELPGFPFLVSTRLYPEWPFAALPQTDEKLARHVVAELFKLDEDNRAATRAMGIHGFVVPADYTPAEEVLRELRLPPFEAAPRFTLQDVWTRYHWQNIGVLLALGVILLLGVSLLLMYRKLAANHHVVLLQKQKLLENEEKFRTILDAAMDGILVADAQTRALVTGNRAICTMLGYSPEELYDLGIEDIHPAEAIPQVKRQFERQLRGELKMAHDLPVKRKDGSVFFADLNTAPMVLGGRKLMVGVFHDVTKRKRDEETLRYKNTVLSILQWISPSAILVVDENNGVVSYNEKFIEMWDLPEEIVRAGVDEPLLRKVCELIENPEQFLARVKYLYEHTKETSRDELRLLDGRIVDRYSSPVIDKDGRYYGRVWDYRDITELKRATEKIRQLNDELELKVRERTRQLLDAQEDLVRKEKLALLGQVVGSVGHELRNPLGVMNNAVYFLQTVMADGDETTREYLEIIKNGVAEADRIVDDLLDSVRTKPPQPTAVSIRELIDRTLGSLTMADTVTVSLDLPETLPLVRVDSPQIQQVFRNLISNGVEAMPEGGTLAINAVENSRDGTVSVSVGDTGCGMTPEVLDNLFQPLITTKGRGIGLGLVVVKNLTEVNGGTIMVESGVGQGTTFTVTLPAANSAGKES